MTNDSDVIILSSCCKCEWYCLRYKPRYTQTSMPLVPSYLGCHATLQLRSLQIVRVLTARVNRVARKESRRQIFVVEEEALSWCKPTKGKIIKIWSKLAIDMEEEVLSRYRVTKEARCKYKKYTGRGEPISWFLSESEAGRKQGEMPRGKRMSFWAA